MTKQIENLSEDKTDLNQVNGTVTITDIGDFCPTNDLYVQIYQLKCSLDSSLYNPTKIIKHYNV